MRLRVVNIFLFFAGAWMYGQHIVPLPEDHFTRVKATGNIHMSLVPAPVQKLDVVTGEAADLLDLEIKEGVLILRTRSELSNSEAIKVKLHYLEIEGLEISKGVRVTSADTLVARRLELDVLSGAKAELKVHVDSLDARVNQGSDIILYGIALVQHVNAYTWGNYLAYDLKTEETFVKAATGAQVKVDAGKILDANATSKAFVGYTGDPEQKRFKTSVGGEISPQSP